MLRAILKKNLKMWEECLPHVEFAYNRATHSMTKVSPFQVVYRFNPHAPIVILPLHTSERIHNDTKDHADFILKIHESTKHNIEKMNEKYRIVDSKGRKEVQLALGDLVWLHLRKDRFSELKKSKLMPRADCPFKIIEKINDNAYKVELPPEFVISLTFNISDLRPYLGEEDEFESMMTPIQEGEDVDDITTMDIHNTSLAGIQGPPITRDHSQELNLQVISFLSASSCYLENRLLSTDLIMIGNNGDDHGVHVDELGGAQDQKGWPNRVSNPLRV
jgi:hypothetical protein